MALAKFGRDPRPLVDGASTVAKGDDAAAAKTLDAEPDAALMGLVCM